MAATTNRSGHGGFSMGVRFWWGLWLALGSMFVIVDRAGAAEPRIKYAEVVRLQGASTQGTSKTATSRKLAFTAYGRAFETDLEQNSRVTSALSTQQRQQLEVTPYKGTLDGLADSWVRLTEQDGRYYGAIWDGSELYLVVPADEAAAFVQSSLDADSDDTLIFRPADAEGGSLEGVCGGSQLAGASGSELYRSLVSELKGQAPIMQAASVRGQVEVSVLGDSQFAAMFSSSSTSVMVSRMNVVDGIYTEQVGVFIIPTDMRSFGSGDDPFSGTDSTSLLQQLGTYRNGQATLRTRAVTHLMTGRDLDGNTVGIAYTRSLCDQRYGVSLSQADYGDFYAPLIVAHELGHNFGAPHDNESGSACASTSSGYLMSPYLSGSSTFSACSLQQMDSIISAATCLQAAQTSDVAVSIDMSSLDVPINESYPVPVTVTSVGNISAESVQLTVGYFYDVQSITVPSGVSCTNSSSISCSFGTLAAGESRQIVINARAPSTVQTASVTATVSASVDRNSDNNSQTVNVSFYAGSDVSIALTAPASVVTADSFDVVADASAAGIDPAENAVVSLSIPNVLQIDSVSVPGGTCTFSAYSSATCQLGSMAVGEQRRVTMRVHALSARASTTVYASIRADNDASSSNNSAQAGLEVLARADVALVTSTSSETRVVGVPFDYSLDVTSQGVQAANNVRLTATVGTGVTVQQATADDASCTQSGSTVTCTWATLPTDASKRVTLRLVDSQTGSTYVNFSVDADVDDYSSNDSYYYYINARYAVDVSISNNSYYYVVEGPTQVSFWVYSGGANVATNVVARVTFPASIAVTGATIPNGTCSINEATVECSLASLSADSWAEMQLNISTPGVGTFDGTLEVGATEDGDSTNNQGTFEISVSANVDVRIDSAPATLEAQPGDTVTIPLVLATDQQPVSTVTFSATGFSQFTSLSVSAPDGGSCSASGSAVSCSFGTLPANSTRRIDITGVVDPDLTSSRSMQLYTYVNGNSDVDYGNNSRYVAVNIILRGDASLSVANTSVTGTVDSSLALPTMSITGIRTVESVQVVLTLPSNLTFVGSNKNCSISGTLLSCSLGTITAGTTQALNVTVRPTSAGTATVSAQLSAPYDGDTQNNSASFSVTANAAASSGGGGGAFNWPLSLVLLLLGLARQHPSSRRTQRT